MDGKHELMVRLVSIFLVGVGLFSGCKKCVECEVRLKKSSDVIGYVDKFCGTDKKVEEEEDRLNAEYTCIECIVQTAQGPQSSGILCGSREFTDSVEASNKAGAAQIGAFVNCAYNRDTTIVRCVLKQ